MKYYILREKHFCKIVFPAPFSKNFCIKHFQCFMGVLLELYDIIHHELGFLGKGYGENLLFREERVCRNGNNENYCLQKEKFKIPQFGFLGKGHGKNLLFPRKEGFSHNHLSLFKNLRFLLKFF